MHRDIVPRAFACDYSPVAELLRRVGPSFRDHHCLSGDRQVRRVSAWVLCVGGVVRAQSLLSPHPSTLSHTHTHRPLTPPGPLLLCG